MRSIHHSGNKSLSGKTVVITGASSGVGKAAALAFAAAGATLILAARRAHALHDLVEACQELGARAKAEVMDVTDVATMPALAASAVEFGGGSIDIWVNNAGVLAAGRFDETPLEIHEQTIKTNLIGYLRGAHAVLPYFKRQGYGVLINNISIGGFVSAPYAGAYSASKAGLQGLMASIRAEMSPWKDIHICDLYPAFLDTPGISHAANYTGAELKLSKALLFDPLMVASAMVQVAIHPKAATYPDFAAPVLKMIYLLFPGLTGVIAEKVMRSYFKKAAPAAANSGNVIHTMPAGTGIHGEGASTSSGISTGKAFAIAGLAVAGIAFFRRR